MLFLQALQQLISNFFWARDVVGDAAGLGEHEPTTLEAVQRTARSVIQFVATLLGPDGDHTLGSGVSGDPEISPLLRVFPAPRLRLQSHTEARFLAGQKGQRESNDTITWPQAVFMGMPLLLREAYAKVGAHVQARAEHAARATPATEVAVRVAFMARRRALLDCLVPAVMLNDGLRTRNYACCLVNEHMTVRIQRDAAGAAVGIDDVLFTFRSDDVPGPRLKKHVDADGILRHRTHELDVGLVSFPLLFYFLTVIRP